MELITKENFNEKIATGRVLVMFIKNGCQICEMVAPAVESLEDTYKGKMNFFKVDCREDKDLMDDFSLNGVPQVLFFNDGKYVGKMAGPYDSEDYAEKIDYILGL